MSDNGYDIWRDVANILVNPTIKTEMGYRVPTKESSLQKLRWMMMMMMIKTAFLNIITLRFLPVGSRKMILPLPLLPLATRIRRLPETSSFCNQRSFKFPDLKYHFDRQTNFRDDNDNWSPASLIHKIKNKDPTQVDIETYIRISKFFQKTTEDKLDDDVYCSLNGVARRTTQFIII